jgi:hypothetical protein
MHRPTRPIGALAALTPFFFALSQACTAGSVGGPDVDSGSPSPELDGGSSSAVDGGGNGNGNGNGGGTGDTDAGTKTIYCGQSSDSECVCATEQSSSSLSADTACDLSGIGAPGLCCAVNGWPAVSGGAFGGCYCSRIFCETDGSVCQCGFGKPTAGDKPVSSCAPQAGEVCCRSKSDIAPTCACYKGTNCLSASDEIVPSCGPSTLECAGSAVTTCR